MAKRRKKNACLVAAIAESGMDNYDVADKVGIRTSMLSEIISGRVQPSEEVARKLEKLLSKQAKAVAESITQGGLNLSIA